MTVKSSSVLRCLNAFKSQRVLANHTQQCKEHHAQRTILPSVDKDGKPAVMKYANIHRQLRAPFAIYADFESVLTPVQNVHPDPTTSSTTTIQNHVACSASYVIVSWDGRFYRDPVLIRARTPDDDVVGEFITRMQNDVAELKAGMEKETPMEQLTAGERAYFHSRDALCHICSKSFGSAEKRVRDHCHVTGSYR